MDIRGKRNEAIIWLATIMSAAGARRLGFFYKNALYKFTRRLVFQWKGEKLRQSK